MCGCGEVASFRGRATGTHPIRIPWAIAAAMQARIIREPSTLLHLELRMRHHMSPKPKELGRSKLLRCQGSWRAELSATISGLAWAGKAVRVYS